MDNNQNEKDSKPYGLGLGEFTRIDNPNWLFDKDAPIRYLVKNWGGSIEITPEWS